MSSRDPQVTNDRRRFHENTSPEGLTDAPERSERLVFGPFALEAASGRLFDGERVVPLAPKPFETLFYLAERPGKVVSKAELMKALWPDTFVTDDVLVQCVVDIRKALGDHPKNPQFVRTLPRRGYQFVAPVHRLSADASPGPAPTQAGDEALSPPVPRRGLRLAAIAAALIVGGLSVGYLASQFTSPRRASGAAGLVPGTLAVLPFRVEPASSETEWLGPGLAELLRGQIGQRPEVQLVARHRVAGALRDAGLEPGRAASGESASQVARALGAERRVAGTLSRMEDRFVLNADLVNERTGSVESSARAEGRWPGDLMAAVDELAGRLSAPGAASDRAFRPVRVSTRSPEAYRLYVEALGWYYHGGRRGAEEARKRLDEAVSLDPAFAYAYLEKAEIDEYLRRWGYGDVDPLPAVRAAAALARDLPERDRRLVELLEAQMREDGPAAMRLGESLLRLYPAFAAESGVPVILGDMLYRQGRWDDLILMAEPRVDAPSVPAPEAAQLSSLLAKAFRQKGEFERALTHARRAVQLWPVSAGPSLLRQRTDLGRISLEAGRRDDAVSELRAVAASADADATNLTDAAWGLYMAGESGAEVRGLVERALIADPAYGNAHHLRGWLLLAGGDAAAAAPSFEEAFARSPRAFGAAHHGFVKGDVPALYYAGVAWQRAGQPDKARRSWQRVVSLCESVVSGPAQGRGPELQRFQAGSWLAMAAARLGQSRPDPARLQGDDATYFLQSARLQAVRGRREPALRALAQALALGPGERQHVRDDPNFESLRDDPEFRQLVGG
jgi:DNA-binding winged helix-turn-helix (wHTH) protein/tetratricopeptide (TPR) repeat protein